MNGLEQPDRKRSSLFLFLFWFLHWRVDVHGLEQPGRKISSSFLVLVSFLEESECAWVRAAWWNRNSNWVLFLFRFFFMSNMRYGASPSSLVSKHVELDPVLVLVSVLEEN